MEGEEISDFAAKFAAGFAPNAIRQSLLCIVCRKIPLEWLLENIKYSFIFSETIDWLIEHQNECELCGLILQSIQAKTKFRDFKGIIVLALSPKFLIIDGEDNLKLKFRVFLRLFADAGKQ